MGKPLTVSKTVQMPLGQLVAKLIDRKAQAERSEHPARLNQIESDIAFLVQELDARGDRLK